MSKIRGIVCLSSAVGAFVAGLAAQQTTPSFEVASVKVNNDRVLVYSGVTTQPGGRLSAKAATLKDLVAYAYAVELRQVEPAAAWMNDVRFDVEARGPDGSTPAQFQAMSRALLVERFGLRTREASKNVDAYALVAGRGGIRLKPSEPGACAPPQPPCFGPVTLVGRIIAPHVVMRELAASLSRIMDRPVVDRTGDDRHFAALKLEWVPDESQYAGWGPGVWSRPVSDAKGPALATALQEHLGLRLEPTKTTIKIIVIEDAVRPAPN